MFGFYWSNLSKKSLEEPDTERAPRRIPDGMSCVRCREFVCMAEPNQDDGKSFCCYSCRENPYR